MVGTVCLGRRDSHADQGAVATQFSNSTRTGTSPQQLQERVKKYRENSASVADSLKRDPERPARENQANRERVIAELQVLAELWHEVMPFIRRIKTLAGDILEPSRSSACYFLFGKFSNGMKALFVLAHHGFHYEAMEIVRSNREALDLIQLFLQEPPDSPLLKKWFEGDIIDNTKAREAFADAIAAIARANNITINPKELKSDIYSTLSRYSHVSYSALLDAYDVYRQDFDFERDAGYHYVLNSSLGYVREEIRSATLALKMFYLSIKDGDSFRDIGAVVRKYGLQMEGD